VYAEYGGKATEIFHRKLNVFHKQKQGFSKIATVTSESLTASFKILYKIAKFEKSHMSGENLMLPAAIDRVETVLDETYAK
jgi:hypothetical protein